MQKKLSLITVSAAIALALLFFFSSNTPEQIAAPEQTSTDPTSTSVEEATPEPVQTTSPEIKLPSPSKHKSEASTDNAPLSVIDQIRAIKNKTVLHQAVIKDHEKFTRYPSNNVRFERLERDPISMMYTTDERTTQSDDKSAFITAWTDKRYILNGDSVAIYARVDEHNKQGIANKLLTEIIYNEQKSFGTYPLTDTDGDGVYRFEVSSELSQDWPAGIYKALIVSSHKKLSESVSFSVAPQVIKLTGEYREQLTSNGDLLFEIEIETTETARYYIRASLYSSSNTPIGSAQHSADFTKGRHWVPLRYYGLMIRDAGEPGPYQLKAVELALASMPMQRMPPEYTDFYTDSYALEEFNNLPYKEQQSLK